MAMDAAVEGVKLILAAADLPASQIYDLRNWGMRSSALTPYASLDWYTDMALLNLDRGFGRQVDASRVLTLSMSEPCQKNNPHLEVMIVDEDLNMSPPINFVFGLTMPYFGTVVSIKRFGQLSQNKDLFKAIFARTVAHEFGHVMGLVSRSRNTRYSLGTHCAGEGGPCLMRQGLSLEEWTNQFTEEIEAGQSICPDCENELKTITNPPPESEAEDMPVIDLTYLAE